MDILNRNELHKVTTVGELKLLKDLPMIEFEARVWEQLGVRFVKREDRRMVSFFIMPFLRSINSLCLWCSFAVVI